MAMQVQLNISQYTQTNKHCRGKPINNYSSIKYMLIKEVYTLNYYQH